MRGVIVVIFEESPTDIDQKVVELTTKVTTAVKTEKVAGFSGEIAETIADVIEMHGLPEGGPPGG